MLNFDRLEAAWMEEIRTLCDLYFHNVDHLKRPDALMLKRKGLWEVVSTDELASTVEAVSCGLMDLGVKPGDKVLLLSENRPEWLVADYGILTAGAINVPPYATLTAKDTAYMANDCDAEVAIVSTEAQATVLLSQKASIPKLRTIVIMDPPDGEIKDLLPWPDLIARGRAFAEKNPGAHRKLASAVGPDDVATIIYTSGTTGVPKGVMLTHRNFVENCRGGFERFHISKDDTALVFLPLSHSFERMIDYCYFWKGVRLAYAESMDKVLTNLQEVRPTIVASVPRFFEKSYARLMELAAHSSYLKKVLIHWSVRGLSEWAAAKGEGHRVGAGLAFKRAVADRIIGRSLRAKLGGRIKSFVSGGAPLPKELCVFFYGAGITIAEGYGLTETSPVISVNSDDAIKFGSPGKPLYNVEVRLAEDGEIIVRGPNVMKGYYKLPAQTAEVLTQDGWLSTGDIGRLDEQGYLFITDRKKELLVTAGGKKVAPQPIEALLRKNKYVEQAVLIGDKKPFITALIYPNWENVIDYARRHGVEKTDPRDLAEYPEVKHLFQNVLDRANAGLSRFEQIKKCRLLPHEFSQENGVLTPTLKVKRRVIDDRYASLIEDMYAAGEEAKPEGAG